MQNNRNFYVIRIIISALIFCLAAIQLFGVWDGAVFVYGPLLGLNMILQAVRDWNENRKLAIFCICTAIFIFIVAILAVVF